jgi:hypothetical protein
MVFKKYEHTPILGPRWCLNNEHTPILVPLLRQCLNNEHIPNLVPLLKGHNLVLDH